MVVRDDEPTSVVAHFLSSRCVHMIQLDCCWNVKHMHPDILSERFGVQGRNDDPNQALQCAGLNLLWGSNVRNMAFALNKITRYPFLQ